MKNRIIVGTLLVSFFGFQACQKAPVQNSGNISSNLKAAAAEVTALNATTAGSVDEHSVAIEKFDGSSPAFRLDGIKLEGGFRGMGPVRIGIPHIDSCVIVSVSSSTYPKEIVIDYGTGCADMRGHIRKGKIIIDISDTLTKAGATQTLTYQNFFIDSTSIVLTESLKNLGKDSTGNWVIEKKYDRTVTKNSDKIVESNTEKETWVAGFGTTSKSDDVFYETGSGSVTVNDSITFNKTITKALLIDRSCEFITSGTVELTKNGSTVTIDYGDGTCDNKATITTNGTTEEIELHGFRFRVGGQFEKHCSGFGHGKK
jgi:hypothetical protein